MHKSKACNFRKVSLVIVVVFSVMFCSLPISPVEAYTTHTWYAIPCEASDGYIWCDNSTGVPATYNLIQSNVSGSAVASDFAVTKIGQSYYSMGGGDNGYAIYRSFLFFNVSSLYNTNATVESAKLQLYLEDDQSTTDFFVHIQFDNETYDAPHIPVLITDYNQSYYTTTGFGNISTNGLIEGANFNITLTGGVGYGGSSINNGIGYLNDTIYDGGMARFALRSGQDIGAMAPTDNEWIDIIEADGTEASQRPVLFVYVEETLPDPSPTASPSEPEVALTQVLSPIYSGVILFGVMLLGIMGFMIAKGNLTGDGIMLVISLAVIIVVCVAIALAIMSGVTDVGNNLF